MANDDPILTTMRFIPQHEVVQKYSAILPDNLTTQAMKESEAYKTYYAFATRKAILKPKYIRVHEGTGVPPRVLDVPTYGSDDEKMSWNSSDEEDGNDESNLGKHEDDDDVSNLGKDEYDDDQKDDDDHEDNDDQDNDNDNDDGNERIDSDNNGDDFVHPMFSTHDEEDKEEDSFDPRVQTSSHVESTDDEDSDEEIQDIEMTNAQQTNVQPTQVTEDTHVIITALVNPEGQQQSSSVSSGYISNMLNPSPDTRIDSIFNLNTESTSLVDVPVTAIAEPPLLSVITTPPPPIPLIIHLQQTPTPTPATVLSSSLQDLPNFGSLFGIVDVYLANKMHEAVKTAIQLQSERLRDEAQAKNADFINKLDDNTKKIIKNQVKEQTSYAVAANLSKLELKKILIEKMESNKSIYRSDEQKNLYKALVDAYESDNLILDTYGDTVSFKRRRDDEDKDEEPSTGSNQGSKRRKARKELESTSALKEKTSKTIGKSTEGSKSHHTSAGESAQAEEPMEYAQDVYSKRRIIAVTKLQIVEWHGYKHLDWIAVHRDDNNLYTFKEGDFKRLRLQDIKDMLILLVQGKLTNLNVEERLAFSVSLQMFTRSIVIQRRVEDLQLGVESFQKKLNITKPNTYIFDLKRRDVYTAYSNPRGFIYHNKDKKNKLMRIDELHKFSDGTLDDVWTALNDRLKRIRMEYLPHTI
ncbi:hypothetical protein Tco_0490341 [Tanacetum coccineum]